MKFIPKSEYRKLYDSLFKSHLSYCISSWGGIPTYRLSTIFSIQKRCVRLLFGKIPSYDHATYYETCARARTYSEHMRKKNYQLENTKPIFIEEKILSLHHLHVHHTFIEVFKIMKKRQPISLVELFQPSLRDTSDCMLLPRHSLEITKHNFVYNGSSLWNSLIGNLLDKCSPNKDSIMVPGSSKFSDLTIPISVIKSRLKNHLFDTQKIKTPGRPIITGAPK